LTDFDWDVAELPGRHFSWRIRGNPLSWLDRFSGPAPDAIVATSMVDLATLRGLHPGLAQAPTLYYFHENQFAYPLGPRQARSLEPQMVQLYGALAADRIVFNSRFNRESFTDGVKLLLDQMPDAVPVGVPDRLAAKAEVLPVPIRPIACGPTPRDPRLIVWNHRWEYDKAPDMFADAMIELAAQGLEFRLALLGPRPQQPPEPLGRIRARLGERIVADGRVSRSQYEAILSRAGIVVSTALHEFQGLAILEAVSAGAVPLVPDTLVYPEQYPDGYRYPPGDTAALVRRLAHWLGRGAPAPPSVDAWTARTLQSTWQRTLQGLVPSGAAPEARGQCR
jgi:glycosyltransferase involved in cell wall biosynthesis